MNKKLIGRRARLSLPDFGLVDQLAKVDTGAFNSSMHYSRLSESNGILSVLIDDAEKPIEFRDYDIAKVKSSNGQIETRHTIETSVIILGEEFSARFTLTNRESMKLPILLGRETLRGRFIVDVEYSATSPDSEYKL